MTSISEENIFRRLKGKMLQRPALRPADDHAQGLFHLLSLAARLLPLAITRPAAPLADQQSET
ncbi:MAG: hypothetical protein IPH82_15900 [Chloroflexi bacterium]|nr:hypothetical protein [Chloroflexota bacterium]